MIGALRVKTLYIGKTPRHSQDPDEMQQQFGPRSGPTYHWTLYGSKLFDSDGISDQIFFQKSDLEENQQMTHRSNKEIYLRKSLVIFLPINLNMCFGCSKEPSH